MDQVRRRAGHGVATPADTSATQPYTAGSRNKKQRLQQI